MSATSFFGGAFFGGEFFNTAQTTIAEGFRPRARERHVRQDERDLLRIGALFAQRITDEGNES